MTKKHLLCALLLSAAMGISGCSLWPSDSVTYGVYFESQDVSGYSRDGIHQLLNEPQYSTQMVDIGVSKDKHITVKAQDLGIFLDIENTAWNIISYGYEDNAWTLITNRFKAFTEGVHIEPVYKLDEVKARTYLAELAKQVDTPGHDAYLTINNGTVTMVPSKEGIRIDLEATLQNLKKGIESNQFSALDMVYTSKNTVQVTNDDLKPLTTILASYTTYYDSSNESRTHNIEIASNKINGTLIKPGQIFSFNDVVGERTAEAGFDDAPVMIDGKLVPGIGGGICQVSSTLFNTALLSGMTIVERTPHFEPVGYIPAGRDATVAYGYLDFQFKNPYSKPVYVLSIMNGGEITIYIIGTPEDDPKSVSITVGNRSEIPNKTITKIDPTIKEDTTQEGHVGLKMYTYRHITYGNGVSDTDTYESIYDPVDTIITKKSNEPTKKDSPQKKKS